MFQVICIGEFDATGCAMPAIGDIVTVNAKEMDGDTLMYELEEYPPIEKDGKLYRFTFEAEAFAPLGGPDERERLEAYQREQLTIEGKLLEGVAAILAEEETRPQDVWERNWTAIQERLTAAHG